MIEFSDDIIRKQIKDIYPLSFEINDFSHIRRSFNDHYFFETGDGRFVLRIYLHRKNMSNILFEIKLLNYLKRLHLKVPALLLTKNSEYLFTIQNMRGDRFFACVFEYVEGEHMKCEEKKNIALTFGKQIAQLHDLTRNYKSNDDREDLVYNELILNPVRYLKDKINQHNIVSDFDIDISQVVESLSKDFELIESSNDYGILHGDPNPSNVLINNGDMFLIDFDHSTKGFRIHDLSVVYLSFNFKTYRNIVTGYEDETGKKIDQSFVSSYSKLLTIKKYHDILITREKLGINSRADEITIINRWVKTMKDYL